MRSVKVLSAMPFTEGEFQKKRVAAYCRISTEFEEQHRWNSTRRRFRAILTGCWLEFSLIVKMD